MPLRSSQDILEVYKAMLRAYLKWVGEQRALHGENLMMWPEAPYQNILTWSGELTAMQQALGLTDAEDEDLMEQIEKEA